MAQPNRTALRMRGLAGGASLATIGIALAGSYAPQAHAQEARAEISEVVVTASRVNRAGFTAPTPVTVIGQETLQNRAALTVADVLFEVPAIRPAAAAGAISQAGGNYVSLRGFGQARTLVLIDGRRFVPSNAGRVELGDAVDTNVIPQAVVDRLDVVTGGASAAWGSDAIAGVINIVLKKSLTGIQGSIQGGLSEQGDAKTLGASLATGHDFAGGRGQFLIAAEYSNRYDMPTNGDRSWSNGQCAYDVSKTRPINGVTYGAVKTCGLTLSGYTNGGVLVSANGAPLPATSPFYGRQFLSSTASSSYRYGQLLGNNVMLGGDGGWISDTATVVAPLERENLYTHTTYDFTPNLKGFFEVAYARTFTDFDVFVNSIGSSSGASPIQVLRGNPYIPGDIAAILAANPTVASINLGRIAPELGNLHSKSENQITSFATGLDGKLGDTWSWNAYGAYGQTNFDTHFTNNIILSNSSAAFDVIINPATGKPDCRINVTGPAAKGTAAFGAAPGCVPANPFGPGSLASAKTYITGDLDNLVRDRLWSAGATISGEPLHSWAGPISLVGGVEWRLQKLSQQVSPYSDFVNPPAYGAGGFQQANPKSFRGSVSVEEVFVETVIPLLKDQPFARSLDLDLAGRRTHYSTVGTADTWKVGLTYRPVEGLLFRFAQSHDIRAASLFDQFGSNTTYGAVLDRAPGANNAAVSFAANAIGNTKLRPEAADTTTIGVTATKLPIEGLAVSIDYYKVKLVDQIGQNTTQDIMNRCYGVATAAGFAPDPAYCALIDRAGRVISNPQLNLGTIDTSGIDMEVSYRHSLGDKGDLSFRFLGSYVAHFRQNSSGLVVVDRAGDLSGMPHWGWTGTTGYKNGPFSAFFQLRYIGKLNRDITRTEPNLWVDPVLKAVTYASINASYKIRDEGAKQLEIFGNINNLFNKTPPFVANNNGLAASFAGQGGGTTSAIFYDTIGRSYTVGMRFRY